MSLIDNYFGDNDIKPIRFCSFDVAVDTITPTPKKYRFGTSPLTTISYEAGYPNTKLDTVPKQTDITLMYCMGISYAKGYLYNDIFLWGNDSGDELLSLKIRPDSNNDNYLTFTGKWLTETKTLKISDLLVYGKTITITIVLKKQDYIKVYINDVYIFDIGIDSNALEEDFYFEFEDYYYDDYDNEIHHDINIPNTKIRNFAVFDQALSIEDIKKSYMALRFYKNNYPFVLPNIYKYYMGEYTEDNQIFGYGITKGRDTDFKVNENLICLFAKVKRLTDDVNNFMCFEMQSDFKIKAVFSNNEGALSNTALSNSEYTNILAFYDLANKKVSLYINGIKEAEYTHTDSNILSPKYSYIQTDKISVLTPFSFSPDEDTYNLEDWIEYYPQLDNPNRVDNNAISNIDIQAYSNFKLKRVIKPILRDININTNINISKYKINIILNGVGDNAPFIVNTNIDTFCGAKALLKRINAGSKGREVLKIHNYTLNSRVNKLLTDSDIKLKDFKEISHETIKGEVVFANKYKDFNLIVNGDFITHDLKEYILNLIGIDILLILKDFSMIKGKIDKFSAIPLFEGSDYYKVSFTFNGRLINNF